MHDPLMRQLIEDSFLDHVQKRELLQMLDRAPERDLRKVFDAFQDHLQKDIDARGAKYEKAVAILDHESKEADNAYEEGKARIEKELEEQLKIVESDLDQREAAWASYDKKIAELQKTHHEALKKAAAHAYTV
jgi:hypothetical protein